jgi:hypothetical protein
MVEEAVEGSSIGRISFSTYIASNPKWMAHFTRGGYILSEAVFQNTWHIRGLDGSLDHCEFKLQRRVIGAFSLHFPRTLSRDTACPIAPITLPPTTLCLRFQYDRYPRLLILSVERRPGSCDANDFRDGPVSNRAEQSRYFFISALNLRSIQTPTLSDVTAP